APALVCVHHNPEESLVGLKDTAELLAILKPRRRVKLVLFGHTHEFRVWQSDGLHFVNLPATSYPFAPDASLGWLRAEITTTGMRIEFRGISGREPEHGSTRELEWRA